MHHSITHLQTTQLYPLDFDPLNVIFFHISLKSSKFIPSSLEIPIVNYLTPCNLIHENKKTFPVERNVSHIKFKPIILQSY